jgi:hypothetical protein
MQNAHTKHARFDDARDRCGIAKTAAATALSAAESALSKDNLVQDALKKKTYRQSTVGPQRSEWNAYFATATFTVVWKPLALTTAV